MITPPTIDSHHSAASTTSSKRYASTFDGEDDDDEDLKPFVAKRSKGNQKNGAGGNGSGAGPKSITEKLERKEARMIRNRSLSCLSPSLFSSTPRLQAINAHHPTTPHHPLFLIQLLDAAQASRDRKKEHAQQLEARVAELEAQLEYARAGSLAATPAPRHPATTPVVTAVLQPPCAPSAYNNSISAPTTPTTSTRRRRTCSRRDRSPSIFSVSSSTPSVGAELLELEDENDTLRTQLHLEQIETARLRSRLESLEERFVLFEQQVSLGGDPSSLGSLLPTHSSNPFTAPNHEPTFTLDSSSTLLLPEPQHLVPSFPPTSSADATTPALPLMTSISSPRKRTRSSSKRTPPTLKIEEHQAPEKAEVEVEEMTKDNRPLIARKKSQQWILLSYPPLQLLLNFYLLYFLLLLRLLLPPPSTTIHHLLRQVHQTPLNLVTSVNLWHHPIPSNLWNSREHRVLHLNWTMKCGTNGLILFPFSPRVLHHVMKVVGLLEGTVRSSFLYSNSKLQKTKRPNQRKKILRWNFLI